LKINVGFEPLNKLTIFRIDYTVALLAVVLLVVTGCIGNTGCIGFGLLTFLSNCAVFATSHCNSLVCIWNVLIFLFAGAVGFLR
jgi:hypothetical protein